MNRDELEKQFTDDAKGIWAWSTTHTMATAIILSLVVGFILGWVARH